MDGPTWESISVKFIRSCTIIKGSCFILTFVSFESTETCLSNYVVPVDNDINTHFGEFISSSFIFLDVTQFVTIYEGWKIWTVEGIKVVWWYLWDTITSIQTLIEKYAAFLNTNQMVGNQPFKGQVSPGIMYWPAMESAPSRLSTASFRNCDKGICAPVKI